MVYLTLHPILTLPLMVLAWALAAFFCLRVLTTIIGLVLELKQLKERKETEKLAMKALQAMGQKSGNKAAFVMPGYEGRDQ